MSEWADELIAFYTGPLIVMVLYILVAALTQAGKSHAKLAVVSGVALLSMFLIARPLSPPTIYLGHVPRLLEGVGAAGVIVAAAVLFLRGRKVARNGASGLVDYLLAFGAFLLTVMVAIGGLLLLASLNPD